MIGLIWAEASDRIIGSDGSLPWHLPEDLQRFKELTMGSTVVMGRVTWESLPEKFRPLPGRRNIVVTRDPAFHAEGAELAASLDAALALAGPAPVVHVVGGAEIYALALPIADELQLTEIDAQFPADTYFPAWDRSRFAEVGREPRETPEGLRYAFVTYRKLPERN